MPLNNTSKVKNFHRAFANSGITAMPNIDTSGATDMAYMFEGCKSLPKAVTLDVSSIFANLPDERSVFLSAGGGYESNGTMLEGVFKDSSVEEVTLLGVNATKALKSFAFGSRYELQVLGLPQYMGVKKVYIKDAVNIGYSQWNNDTPEDEKFDIYD